MKITVQSRSSFTLAALSVAVLAVALAAVPAYAETTTTTSTWTLANRNTVTYIETRTDGVLSSVSYTEVSPAGLVVVDRDISYYPSGVISEWTEVRTSLGGAYQTTQVRQYDENGVVREQYVKIVSGGETIAEQFTTFDASGYLVSKEERILTTLADGTRVWSVTVETWSTNVLVSSTTTEYPYGYDFNAPVADDPPAWPGEGKGDGAPGQDPNGWRPGEGGGDNGQGDQQHDHYGPPGQNKKAE